MVNVVILAAGEGSKCWPYATVRPKVMVPIANKPIIDYNIQVLLGDSAVNRIIIAAGEMSSQIKAWFKDTPRIEVLALGPTAGTADALLRMRDVIGGDEQFLLLYGDTILSPEDIRRLLNAALNRQGGTVLVKPLNTPSSDLPACRVADGKILEIVGHPRERMTHCFCGFVLGDWVFPYLERNPGFFNSLDVGMMPPKESFLEMSLALALEDGHTLAAVEVGGEYHDIDRPWDILIANRSCVDRICGETDFCAGRSEGAVDPSALIEGEVSLGQGSRIGKNVIIRGNCICGDDTIIENGAIIQGNCVIGNKCTIRNYCQITGPSTVGDGAKVLHCAEFEGILMEGVYLYHFMEVYGIVGRNSDVGGGTVCGTLRFDDCFTSQRVKGRYETPSAYGNAAYIGDYCRTGINVSLMPGKKMGVYSIAGPGVVLKDDLPERTLVEVKQELSYRSWGPERYGW